jgi:hypothetical protein
MEDGEGGDVQLEEAHRLGHGAAALIHEGGGFEQDHAFGADAAILHPALKLLLHRAETMGVGDHVAGHEADIVPVHLVLVAGVTQPNPQLHG